ncbi:YggT family protein [Lacticaseibacillus mingshuiensis]|uniref:YggT family protein n=1 Tax=Lacticaseibacillus mingshuiensis TaxID=2799574 RepID=UPI00194E0D12|nr:YggT family protein [Lacticaseibacillus mingshuiensis]
MFQVAHWLYLGLTGVLYIYMLMIAVEALLSWFPGAQDSFVGRWVGKLVDPYVDLFRRFIPPIFGLDLAPVVGFFLLVLVRELIDVLYMNLAIHLL